MDENSSDSLSLKMLPRHVAISIAGIVEYAKKNKKPVRVVFREQIKKIKDVIRKQVELKIPLLTFNLVPSKIATHEENFLKIIDGLVDFLNDLKTLPIVSREKIKISVLGKWYYLPSRAIDAIKGVIEETKDYDGFFVNLCINYDGQEEIVDACKLIARKIKAGKLDPDAINRDLMKENIYSSYFLPPELIIMTGKRRKLGTFLLWDSATANIYFTQRGWPDFKADDLKKIVYQYMKER